MTGGIFWFKYVNMPIGGGGGCINRTPYKRHLWCPYTRFKIEILIVNMSTAYMMIFYILPCFVMWLMWFELLLWKLMYGGSGQIKFLAFY